MHARTQLLSILGLTIHVEDDALGAWSQDEKGAFGIGVILGQQGYHRVVAWRSQHLIWQGDAI